MILSRPQRARELARVAFAARPGRLARGEVASLLVRAGLVTEDEAARVVADVLDGSVAV